MKYLYLHLICILLASLRSYAGDVAAREWGPATNNVKMCIMVKDLTYVLSADDIIDVSHFIGRLSHQSDPISSFLWKSLTHEEQVMLKEYDAQAHNANQVKDIIAEDLNKIIGGTNIFSWERFSGVKVRGIATALIFNDPTVNRGAQPYINRMLLEDAFPSELSRTKKAGERRIKIGEPVVLTIIVTNMSTNETFQLGTIGGIDDDYDFSFEVIGPSGRGLSQQERQHGRSGAVNSLDQKIRQFAFSFKLSSIYKFDQIGTYTIVARRHVEWPGGGTQHVTLVENGPTESSFVLEESFFVVSNPLTIRIVADK
jgi:hypothetical protein